jgi:hypothetical protein
MQEHLPLTKTEQKMEAEKCAVPIFLPVKWKRRPAFCLGKHSGFDPSGLPPFLCFVLWALAPKVFGVAISTEANCASSHLIALNTA